MVPQSKEERDENIVWHCTTLSLPYELAWLVILVLITGRDIPRHMKKHAIIDWQGQDGGGRYEEEPTLQRTALNIYFAISLFMKLTPLSVQQFGIGELQITARDF